MIATSGFLTTLECTKFEKGVEGEEGEGRKVRTPPSSIPAYAPVMTRTVGGRRVGARDALESLVASVLHPLRLAGLPRQRGSERREQIAQYVSDDHVVVDSDSETQQHHRPTNTYNHAAVITCRQLAD